MQRDHGQIYQFQSTLPHGSDPLKPRHRLTMGYFNPRSLTGATASDNQSPHPQAFQSTLPHGSDFLLLVLKIFLSISIHAPSRERQSHPHHADGAAGISIHAPSRERLGGRDYITITILFQSTLPHGSDYY